MRAINDSVQNKAAVLVTNVVQEAHEALAKHASLAGQTTAPTLQICPFGDYSNTIRKIRKPTTLHMVKLTIRTRKNDPD